MKINEILISERKKRDISQRGLALKSGISNATISRIESGDVVPDTATLTKLANALNLDINYLLGNIENNQHRETVELDGVYLRLAKEAQEKGIHPDDVRKIISLYETFKRQDGE